MEDWKNGRLGNWKNGMLENWKKEILEEWKNGRMEKWNNEIMKFYNYQYYVNDDMVKFFLQFHREYWIIQKLL